MSHVRPREAIPELPESPLCVEASEKHAFARARATFFIEGFSELFAEEEEEERLSAE